jgi:hypothetical protein
MILISSRKIKMSHSELLHCCLTVHRLHNSRRKYCYGLMYTTITPISGWHIIQLITAKPYLTRIRRIYGAVFINNTDSSKCIVAYRGSTGFVEWMHNLNVRRGNHVGYNDLFSRFQDLDIPEDVREVMFTGLSMGGAMATLAYTSNKGDYTKHLITFGSPIANESEFCYSVSTDPVPYLGKVFNISSSKNAEIKATHWWQYLPYGGHAPQGYWTGLGASLSEFPIKPTLKCIGEITIDLVFLMIIAEFLIILGIVMLMIV